MLGKNIWLKDFPVTDSRCENLHFYLHMLSDIDVKASWNTFRCKYQLKQITTTREESVTNSKNYILRKMDFKFQNPNFNIVYKIAFWIKQKWVNKELIIIMEWDGQVIGTLCLLG